MKSVVDDETKERRPFYSNYHRCATLQAQHIYAVLGKSQGGAKRGAVISLRQDYEKRYKYTGKV